MRIGEAQLSGEEWGIGVRPIALIAHTRIFGRKMTFSSISKLASQYLTILSADRFIHSILTVPTHPPIK